MPPKAVSCQPKTILEDLLDIEEANRRIADPQPGISLENILHEFGLEGAKG